ncbi:hypothetical protein LMG23994_07160 [Cupriavidus pinatubonensis]|uniref:Uncharacterized protein n=1 Tax=Cupriavidus pinatubonensis TaxID=248026 RepID=A0ABM8Y4K5_9BURK|nr:hypothetical protein LMG23994_07160 [Cupriavidus pinatubonensis]
MSKVVYTRSITVVRASQTDLPGKLEEHLIHVLVQEFATLFRDKKIRRPLGGDVCIAQFGVADQ